MISKKRPRYIIGVGLGGTKIFAGALTEDGRGHHGMRSIPTAGELGGEGGAGRIYGVIEGVIRDTMAETDAKREDFIGIGVGASGPLDREKGLVIVAPNLGWKNYPLRDRISTQLGLPTTLDNDANCATLGEWWQGAARGGRNVIGMTIGTGIGGGILLDRKLFHGASELAAEVGPTPLHPHVRSFK